MPLGDTSALCPIAMVNLLGDLWDGGEPHWGRVMSIAGVKLHLYGKKTPRPGRKMGHITVVAESATEALKRVTDAWEVLAG